MRAHVSARRKLSPVKRHALNGDAVKRRTRERGKKKEGEEITGSIYINMHTKIKSTHPSFCSPTETKTQRFYEQNQPSVLSLFPETILFLLLSSNRAVEAFLGQNTEIHSLRFNLSAFCFQGGVCRQNLQLRLNQIIHLHPLGPCRTVLYLLLLINN